MHALARMHAYEHIPKVLLLGTIGLVAYHRRSLSSLNSTFEEHVCSLEALSARHLRSGWTSSVLFVFAFLSDGLAMPLLAQKTDDAVPTKYKKIAILGKGSFGTTYLAEHSVKGRVALKEIEVQSANEAEQAVQEYVTEDWLICDACTEYARQVILESTPKNMRDKSY
jgi:serine/threonine protein kinase